MPATCADRCSFLLCDCPVALPVLESPSKSRRDSTNAAELMVMPLAERLAFPVADSLASPEPAPMSTPAKVGLVVLGVLVAATIVFLIACDGSACLGG
jgi:hypothetical protein